MSFPTHDNYWNETADFIKTHIDNGERLIAPSQFWEKFPGQILPYSQSSPIDHNCRWAVIHKGMLGTIDHGLLRRVSKKFRPVFSNEVFVVFSAHREIPEVDRGSAHIRSLRKKMHLQRLKMFFRVNTKKKQILYLVRHLGGNIERTIKRKIKKKLLSTSDIDYSTLPVTEIKRLMDERYSKEDAYNLVYLWDTVRADELNKISIELISPTKGKRILEIGCGLGGAAPLISECREFVGTDLSEIATSQANETFGDKPHFRFLPMDAMDLKFDDSQFDIVLAREVIEHLQEPRKAIKEAFRVLKPKGLFLVTSPNRDSLHLRVNRMLGHADFKCCYDHIKEYSFREAEEMLTTEGFTIKKTRGLFLLPYWGIPDIDLHVRHLTDNDPQMIEMLSVLGERAGAEYAFEFAILCAKPGTGK